MTASVDLELAELVAEYYDDPLAFVLECYPWGEGELEHDTGPDVWQRELLADIGREVKERGFNGRDPVSPLRIAVASGHGIGKSVMMAWIANWIMSTREECQGTITANTFTQLETKTWPAIQRWTKLCITREWWVVNVSGSMYHKDHRETWFLNCQSSDETNSEAFAGQHQKSSTSFYLFDEASAIPDKIWEVAQGGMTDGEPMHFAFGNPTRNTGEFHEAIFGARRHRWNGRSIDSRTCKFPNKGEIDEEIADYGIDSDRVRVRYLGLPPRASEHQLISSDVVERARSRPFVESLEDEPLIAGVDVPDGGSAWFIVRFRRGNDARSIPPIRIAGSQIDRPGMIARLASVLKDKTRERRVSMMFIDSAFGAAIVTRLNTLLYENVVEVNFGSKSPDPHYANYRSFMWNSIKEWLDKGGMIPKDDTKLQVDLCSPGFHFNKSNAIVLESKEEMAHPPKGSGKSVRPSPDDGDALALTFAAPVAPIQESSEPRPTPRRGGSDSWMMR